LRYPAPAALLLPALHLTGSLAGRTAGNRKRDVNALFNDDPDDKLEEQAARPWLKIAAVIVALVLLGSGSAVAWRSYGANAWRAFAAARQPSPADTAREAELNTLRALQQQSLEKAEAATQLIASQEATIKSLSDQLAALSAKVEALQRPMAQPAPVSTPVPKPAPKPLTQAPVTGAKPAVPAPPKKPAIPGAPTAPAPAKPRPGPLPLLDGAPAR
jgi:uncharacterized coiled-coil protein SlyX